MKNPIIIIFSFLFCCLSIPICSQTDFNHHHLRIENEYKLRVPDSCVINIWEYLEKTYQNPSVYLSSLDTSFHAKFSNEIFIDQYFDTEKRELHKGLNGIRHRTRKVPGDTLNKKNKQLIQIKLSQNGENLLERFEYKFPVRYYSIQEDSLHNHPFLGMVVKERRYELIELLKSQDIDPYLLLPSIKLIQNRNRIYILKDSLDFATISLDKVRAKLDNRSVDFTEIEMELNEDRYTKADSAERGLMKKIREEIINNLLTAFPFLIQDQTPKYNKAYALLSQPKIKAQMNNEQPKPVQYLIAILILLLFFTGIILVRKSNQ
jgi:hypothetical protein